MFDLKLKEHCNSFDFVNIPKINIWLIKVKENSFLFTVSAHVLHWFQFCQPNSCPFPPGALWPAVCPELLEDLLKSVYGLSCRQVSLHKAKLPSKECNNDHAFTTIKYFKLISGNETKGEAATQTIHYFFAKRFLTPGVPEVRLVLPAENVSSWCLRVTQDWVRARWSNASYGDDFNAICLNKSI